MMTVNGTTKPIKTKNALYAKSATSLELQSGQQLNPAELGTNLFQPSNGGAISPTEYIQIPAITQVELRKDDLGVRFHRTTFSFTTKLSVASVMMDAMPVVPFTNDDQLQFALLARRRFPCSRVCLRRSPPGNRTQQ